MNTKLTVSDFLSLRGRVSAIRAVECALLAIFLSVLPVAADTVSFQQDIGGYTSTVDTFLQADPLNSGTDNSAAAAVGWDGDDPNGTGFDVYALIRFDAIIGALAGQVPAGSEITSATLFLNVFDPGDTGQVHDVSVAWAESATFSSFCGASCDEGVEHGPLTSTAPASTGTQAVNVTASLQSWVDGATNFGWIIRPPEGGVGGVDARSSEFGTIAQRPRLEVVYDEGPPVVGNLLREPYLTLSTPDSQTICWRSDVTSNSRVQYGLIQGTLDQEVNDAAVVSDHCVEINGLSDATRYYYNVGSSAAVQGGGTASHYFDTQPLPGDTTPFTFWAVGDGGNGTPDQINVMNAMLAEQGDSPDFALYLGDIAYNSGTDAEFTNNYFAPYDPVIRNTVVWPTLGNHEGISTTTVECWPPPCASSTTGPYYGSFVLPTAGEAGGVGSGTEAYYSFDYGNTHFISMNSHTPLDQSPGGPMATWLALDLASTSQQWVVAFWHHPPYSKGTHDSDGEGGLIEMRENIVPILEAGGVDLVLTGHSHNYERSFLIDGTYSTPTPSFATLQSAGNIVDDGDGKLTGDGPYLKSPGVTPHEGAVYVVAGHGGQSVGGSGVHPVMYFRESFKGSCLIDVDANTMTLRNVRMDGAISDDFTIQKGDLPPRVTSVDPAKDAVLSTLPQVQVTFSTDVTGVTAGDLTVNGIAATSVVPTSASIYVFSGYAAPADGPVSVVMAAGSIVDAGEPGLIFAGDAWSYTIDTSPPAIASEIPTRGGTIGTLLSVTVNFTKSVFNVSADDLLVNGSAATTLSGNDGTPGPYIFGGFAEPAEGLVSVELLQDGIQDDQALLFPGDTWNYELVARLTVNEFLASNDTAAADENGEFDDYIEIYNPSNATIDMSGMHLTDNVNPAQYEIPAGVTIGPKEFLIFWCDSQTAQGPMHTNFNLSRAGEQIGLYDTAANGFAEIEAFSYATQTTDISSGRFPDGNNGFVTMPPTPGAENEIDCTVPADCIALDGACTAGNCVGGVCVAEVANEGGGCDDGVSCTISETCSSGVCGGGTDNCPAGEVCNLGLDICEAGVANELPIVLGDDWRYIINTTAEPDPAWRSTGFNDSSWSEGPGGICYSTDCASECNTDIPSMQSNAATTYMRRVFHVDNAAAVQLLTLTTTYDDGFVAFINGVEVARSNVWGDCSVTTATVCQTDGDCPGGETCLTPAFDRLAGNPPGGAFNHECNTGGTGGPGGDEVFDISAFIPDLVSGTNVIAIQGHNVTLASTDFVQSPKLSSVEGPIGCTIDDDCDDGLFCNGDETCNTGTSTCEPGTPPDCGDGVGCTVDSCNEVDDDCDNTPDDGACDDSNVCTDDTCDVGSDCQNVDNTGPCEDGDFCTGPDACAGGGCVAGLPIDCDDSVDCTDDSCDTGSGCINADNCPPGDVCNQGLGICETGPAAPDLPIVVGDDWTYFRGTVEPTPGADLRAWTELLFAEPGWEGPAPSGFGYGADCSSLHGTVLDGTNPPAMSGNYVSVYARRLFNIDNPAAVTALELTMDYDDGWVAYVNGVEVARSAGMGGTVGVPPTFDQTTQTGDHECSLAGVPNAPDVVDISAAIPSLTVGANVLAIQGHNRSSTSSDFSLIPSMTATVQPLCTVDGDCDDFNECTDDTCNTGTGECVFTPDDGNLCTDGETCTDDACSGGACVSTPNDGNACTDSIACTDDTCSGGSCQGLDNCTGGDVCDLGTGICETPSALQAGDVIISGFQASTAIEWIELFNTTDQAISLEGMNIVGRLDLPATPDGDLDDDWDMVVDSAPDLTGLSIAANSFFLIRETTVADTDLLTTIDLSTGEMGATERALSLELTIDAVHMDYVVYGRRDGADSAAVPPGDIFFDGVSYPRNETIRTCAPLSAGACNPGASYVESVIQRLSDNDLYAGYDVEGFYADEVALGDGFPVGVWSSDHGVTPAKEPRHSGSTPVLPPTGTPCTLDSECDDNDVCNGIETCVADFCQNGTPLVCNDGDVCTDDSCDASAGCETTNNTAPCNDANACTSGDVCGAGVCLGTPISCNDSLTCTDDSCDTLLGCQNVDNCPAGQACNAGTDTCEVGPTIAMFQEGANGYTGTEDTFIQEASGAAVNGASEVIEWDLSDGSPAGPNSILVQFGNIFGNGAGQVPLGATIVSATLEYTVGGPGDAVGEPATLHEVLVAWDESVSNDTLGGDPGATPGDEYDATVIDTALGDTLGTQSVDVTSSLQAWSDGLSANNGWIFIAESGGTGNGVEARSSEYAVEPLERPKLIVEYSDLTAQAEMSCALSSPIVGPGGSVDLEVFLENLGGLPGVRGFQTQIQIALTSGSGSLSVPCPGGVFIDEARSDYIFFTETNDASATTCALQRASASMLTGSTAVGPGLEYLSEYTLEVGLGTTAGTTFEISFVASPGSRLADETAAELPLSFGPACTLTVEGCGLDADCDDSNDCTTDTCNAGTCENTLLDCSGFDDDCNTGVCNPGTGACEAQPDNEGLTCDDLDACTTGDVCTAGVCGGPPLNCNDASACTNDACVAGSCVYTPSGVCSITGNVIYYRDNASGGFEPSAKPVPEVDIDIDTDDVSDALTGVGGAYSVAAGGTVEVTPLSKLQAIPRPIINPPVTSFDASFIAQESVGLISMSDNQLVAGDVSGNGEVSAFDAALVAQFSVALIDHFTVGEIPGGPDTDWAFLRCDNYVDATNQDCGAPSYSHDPLLGSEVDNFHAVLYGDVTGNWQADAGPAPPAAVGEELRAVAQDRARADQVRNLASAGRAHLLRELPNGTLRPGTAFDLGETTDELVDGVRRRTFVLAVNQGDGIQGLNLELRFDENSVKVVDVQTAEMASDFNLLTKHQGGTFKIGLYNALPMQGSGDVISITVELGKAAGDGLPFKLAARANERKVPVRTETGGSGSTLKLSSR